MLWKFNGSRFKTVNLHNAHVGVPCILACNGPSFREVPAERLCGPGRIVIGVNNVYPRLRPDYWHGVDTPENFDQALCFEPFPKILRAGTDQCKVAGIHLSHLVNTFFVDLRKTGNVWDWSERATFYESKNSLLSALQLALWLGMRNITLAGVDLGVSRISAPELGYEFGHSKGGSGKAELLHAILHTGNESNKRKLLLGRGWAATMGDGESIDTGRWDRFIERMIREGRGETAWSGERPWSVPSP